MWVGVGVSWGAAIAWGRICDRAHRLSVSREVLSLSTGGRRQPPTDRQRAGEACLQAGVLSLTRGAWVCGARSCRFRVVKKRQLVGSTNVEGIALSISAEDERLPCKAKRKAKRKPVKFFALRPGPPAALPGGVP